MKKEQLQFHFLKIARNHLLLIFEPTRPQTLALILQSLVTSEVITLVTLMKTSF